MRASTIMRGFIDVKLYPYIKDINDINEVKDIDMRLCLLHDDNMTTGILKSIPDIRNQITSFS